MDKDKHCTVGLKLGEETDSIANWCGKTAQHLGRLIKRRASQSDKQWPCIDLTFLIQGEDNPSDVDEYSILLIIAAEEGVLSSDDEILSIKKAKCSGVHTGFAYGYEWDATNKHASYRPNKMHEPEDFQASCDTCPYNKPNKLAS